MTSYDKRMEESEQKLQSRLEDFEAERRDAELAFKVKIRDSHVCVIHLIISITPFKFNPLHFVFFCRWMSNAD